MKTFYIRIPAEAMTVFKNKDYPELYEVETEIDLLNEADKWDVDTVDEVKKTCTIKKVIYGIK